jgi:GNAT superfamily N-acetyltransferase
MTIWSATLRPVPDVASLDIRLAGPEDAGALAGTTRLGFESYREWAPDDWRPPPRSLELRAIRERLKQKSTWCAVAIEADGEHAGHVGITHAAERDRPHVRIPGRAHLWMLFLRPPWWGTGLATRLHRLAIEEAARQGYESIRLYTPEGQARARAFYAREGWVEAGRPFAEPLLGLDLVEYRRALD